MAVSVVRLLNGVRARLRSGRASRRLVAMPVGLLIVRLRLRAGRAARGESTVVSLIGRSRLRLSAGRAASSPGMVTVVLLSDRLCLCARGRADRTTVPVPVPVSVVLRNRLRTGGAAARASTVVAVGPRLRTGAAARTGRTAMTGTVAARLRLGLRLGAGSLAIVARRERAGERRAAGAATVRRERIALAEHVRAPAGYVVAGAGQQRLGQRAPAEARECRQGRKTARPESGRLGRAAGGTATHTTATTVRTVVGWRTVHYQCTDGEKQNIAHDLSLHDHHCLDLNWTSVCKRKPAL